MTLALAAISQAIPLTDPASWAADYPPAAIRNEDTGTVRYEVAVGPMGEVTDCKIVESSGSTILDEATCHSIARHACFQPPKAGDPVSASYRGKVEWSLDHKDQPAKATVLFVPNLAPRLIAAKTVIGYGIGADGRVRDCTIVSSSGEAKLDEAGCRILSEKGRFTPPTGSVAPQTMSIEWRSSP